MSQLRNSASGRRAVLRQLRNEAHGGARGRSRRKERLRHPGAGSGPGGSGSRCSVEGAESGKAEKSSQTRSRRGNGSCDGYVNLYLACLRAAGVACRQVSGYLFQPAIHVTEEYVDPASGMVYLERLRHTWVEFYLPGAGWLPADPTFT